MRNTTSVRRSFVLPADLLDALTAYAPVGAGDNLNALVRAAIEDYVARQRKRRFAEEMAAMARDPAAMAVNSAVADAFECASNDGLDGL